MNKPIHPLLLAALLLAFTACSKGDDAFYYDGESSSKTETEQPSADAPLGEYEGSNNAQSFSAIATLYRNANDEYYLQIDADLRVYPANFKRMY